MRSRRSAKASEPSMKAIAPMCRAGFPDSLRGEPSNRFESGPPHSGQNFLPDLLSASHLEQCIERPPSELQLPMDVTSDHGHGRAPPNEPVFRSSGPSFPLSPSRRNPLVLGDAN